MKHSANSFAIAIVLLAGNVFAETPSDNDDAIHSSPIRASGSLRAGTELDDNVRRATVEPESGFLSRYFANLKLLGAIGTDGAFAFSAGHGGKFFFDSSQGNADTLITKVDLNYQHRVVDNSLTFFANVGVKDRTERVSSRDYNRGGGAAGLSGRYEALGCRASVGWRYFAYKPSPESSSTNVEYIGTCSLQLPLDLRLSGGYTRAQRAFKTNRFGQFPEGILEVPNDQRRDTFQSVSTRLTYEGSVIGSLGYTFGFNRSNSFGQGLERHAVEASATIPLPARFFLSFKGELQRTSYEDRVLLDADFLIDEENRNTLVASVAKSLGEHWEVELRYSLYLQEFGVGDDYQRQTFFLAAAYVFD